MTVWVGVDPGWAAGAAAAVDDDGRLVDMIRISKATLPELADWFRGHDDAAMVAIERVGAMPRQGVASTFKFGRGYGRLEGLVVAAGIPYIDVAPRAWQAGMGIPPGDPEQRKRALRARAQSRWPAARIVAESADAPLIADWCRRTHQQNRL